MNRNRVSAHINSMSAWRREHAAHAIRVQDFHPPHWTEQLAKPFPAGKTKEKGIKVLSSDGPSSGSNCLSRRRSPGRSAPKRSSVRVCGDGSDEKEDRKSTRLNSSHGYI